MKARFLTWFAETLELDCGLGFRFDRTW